MSYQSTVLADNPIAYWRLDETSGVVATDQGPNHRDGSFTGSYTLGTASLLPGGSGKSVTFGGVSEGAVDVVDTRAGGWNIGQIEMNVGRGWADLAPPFSIEWWYRWDAENHNASNPWYAIIVKPGAYGLLQHGNSGGTFPTHHLNYSNRGSTDNDLGWAANLATTYYGVVTFAVGGTVKLYINGTLVTTTTGIGAPNLSTSDIFIGRDDGSPGFNDLFNGAIDEVALYSYELSATQIAAHWAAA